VSEAHLGVPVQCGRCTRTFTTRGESAVPATLRLEIGAATSPGRVRDRNEDSFLVQHLVWSNLDDRRELAALVLADGMGGAAAGDRASGLVIRSAGAALAPLVSSALGGAMRDAAAVPDVIAAALREANRAVWSAARENAQCKGMGATGVVVVIWDGQVSIGHVGDCRVYHQRAGQLAQITRDQTLVARMVELGQLTPRQALRHHARNEVTNAIGKAAQLDFAPYQLRLAAGDWLVLACDGLHAHLDEKALQAEIAKGPPSAAPMAHHLVQRTDELGGSDNCTVIAVRAY
jgi:protein phosphatase